jgi:single-strand DNA-binding protein
MYENTHRIIGFLGMDAEARTTKTGRKYTVLFVATKSSYKDKKAGKYKDGTEWHRFIVLNMLGEWAEQLKKGAHVQVVGESQTREYPDKKHKKVMHRITEIKVRSILKLDRAAKAAEEEAPEAAELDEEIPD